MGRVSFRKLNIDGLNIFYREAGQKDAPAMLLLHGFPSASHMFRDLIPRLSDRFHVVAPDFPGFGQSDMPSRMGFSYTFAKTYWRQPTQTHRDALRSLLSPETTLWQYTHGVDDAAAVSPDGYSLDDFYMARPRAHEVQLDLLLDYADNVALYPVFQNYLRTHTPRLLAVWGKNDPFFLPAGAEAFKRDVPGAVVRFFDTGHFALETHADEIAAAIREFLIPHSTTRPSPETAPGVPVE